MKNIFIKTFVSICLFFSFMGETEAIYTLDVVNNFNEKVGITVPVEKGSSIDTKSKIVGRDFYIRVPYHGVVSLIDIAHNNNPCEYPHWGVRIQYQDKLWHFYYDGEGRITITINADGSITPTGNGQMILGDDPPECR